MTCRWFSLGIPVASTNKTDGQYITEILLKVALNTIKQSNDMVSIYPTAGWSITSICIPHFSKTSVARRLYRKAENDKTCTCIKLCWYNRLPTFVFVCGYWCPTHIVLCFSSSCVTYVDNFAGLSVCDCPRYSLTFTYVICFCLRIVVSNRYWNCYVFLHLV